MPQHASPDSPFSLANLMAAVTDAVPDRIALVAGPRRLTYRALLDRSTRLARHLVTTGVRPGENVAILSFNRAEWVESFLGVLRAGAVPVNVNYRYVAGELRHVLSDSHAVALIAEDSLATTVSAVRSDLPRLRHVLLLEDGTERDASLDGADYEESLAAHGPDSGHGAVELPGTSGDDHYLLYTGGTTGYPKGVLWRQADVFRAAVERREPGAPRAGTPRDVAERAARCFPLRMLVLGPLMHAAGQWNALSMLLCGKSVVLSTDRSFRADRVLELAHREGVHAVQLVGDAMARPLARHLLTEPDLCPDLTSVRSGGTPLTPSVRGLWRAWREDVALADAYGGSETGVCGSATAPDEHTSVADSTDRRSFTMGGSIAVLDGALRPLPPGSVEVGRIARTGRIPLGYYNDPIATARTFPTDGEGRRWALSGDYGTRAGDGSIVLLGRGSVVINTAGEKVYPEEVEAVLKAHPSVEDVIVVPAPDERLGQRVTALVSLASGSSPDEGALRAHCRVRLAGFKVPRTVHFVDRVRRTAVGKQDYRWAASVAGEDPPAPAVPTSPLSGSLRN
ncbi:acyl-CoA synthetase [Nocardiopsis sp. L17-MgMaSL7]|uniref:acyl-CoA synthetase n=1 Tax=Nocardiopsis sp. L17-MgMaSL7 TaxID=1938893 RepID=UPI000D70E0B1|nr:acyl-CoA synthetase [Nocardiopsis sp. L17-MgMaSL7]PWV58052.1 fatty-acyl-CoA synthase [Nocardiopsis sp. L17-MgMaSL7]